MRLWGQSPDICGRNYLCCVSVVTSGVWMFCWVAAMQSDMHVYMVM
jgi:hypothetical protein